jgi:hypothetical protein
VNIQVEKAVQQPIISDNVQVEKTVQQPIISENVQVEKAVQQPIVNANIQVEKTVQQPVNNENVQVEKSIQQPIVSENIQVEKTVQQPVNNENIQVEKAVQQPVNNENVQVEKTVQQSVNNENVQVEKTVQQPVNNENIQTEKVNTTKQQMMSQIPVTTEKIAVESEKIQPVLKEVVAKDVAVNSENKTAENFSPEKTAEIKQPEKSGTNLGENSEKFDTNSGDKSQLSEKAPKQQDIDEFQKQIVTFNIKDVQFSPLKSMDVLPETPVIAQTFEGIKENISLGKNEFNIKLNPEGLGEINVNITKQDGKMLVTMTATNPQTAKILNEQLHTLRDIVKTYGAEINPVNTSENIPKTAYETLNSQVTDKIQVGDYVKSDADYVKADMQQFNTSAKANVQQNVQQVDISVKANVQQNIQQVDTSAKANVQQNAQQVDTSAKTNVQQNIQQVDTLAKANVQQNIQQVDTSAKVDSTEPQQNENFLKADIKEVNLEALEKNIATNTAKINEILKSGAGELKNIAMTENAVNIAFKTAALDTIQAANATAGMRVAEMPVDASVKNVQQPNQQNGYEKQYDQSETKDSQQNTPNKDSQQRNRQPYYNFNQQTENEEITQDLNDFVKWYQTQRAF